MDIRTSSDLVYKIKIIKHINIGIINKGELTDNHPQFVVWNIMQVRQDGGANGGRHLGDFVELRFQSITK